MGMLSREQFYVFLLVVVARARGFHLGSTAGQ